METIIFLTAKYRSSLPEGGCAEYGLVAGNGQLDGATCRRVASSNSISKRKQEQWEPDNEDYEK